LLRSSFIIVFCIAIRSLGEDWIASLALAMTKSIQSLCSQKNSGFTIIELSIVFVVLSFIGSVGLSFMASKAEVERERTTIERMEYVMRAIDDYAYKFGRVPCPANGALTLAVLNFGKAEITGSACTSETYNDTNSGLLNNVVAGVVPVEGLGIPSIYMMDGWNRRITYVVDEDFIEANDIATAPAANANIMIYDKVEDDSAKVNINRHITDSYGVDTDGGGPSDGGVDDFEGAGGAVVLIISHGKNGQGAWIYKGSATRLNKAAVATDFDGGTPAHLTLEGENNGLITPATNFDNNFVYFPRWELDCYDTSALNCADGDANSGNKGKFDDILMWRTLAQLKGL